MHFSRLRIAGWQQFDEVDVSFERPLTILTGANGSGKTTLLNILARHAEWNQVSLATPIQEKLGGAVRYVLRFLGVERESEAEIGAVHYSDGGVCSLRLPAPGAVQYSLKLANQKQIPCFFVPSHRSVFRYHSLSQIPTAKKSKQEAFSEVYQSNRQRYEGQHTQPASFFMKNSLISWVINGYGVQSGTRVVMPPDPEQVRYFEGFQQVLKRVLPPTLGFEELEIRNMEVVFVCNAGSDDFVLETASGGVTALIDLAWQIYMYSTRERSDFTVLIDEVENHLHPTLQRRVLSDLMSAFPSVRFIVSTHSPLVVSSVREADVFVLQYNDRKKVISQRLDFESKAKTATEILDEVLGVTSTFPIWAEVEINRILRQLESKDDSDAVRTLRESLKQIGLERLFPEALTALLNGKND